MDNTLTTNRQFCVFSSVEDETHCFVVLKDGSDGFKVFDAINELETIEAISCNRKAKFLVDTHLFVDCAVLEVAFREEYETMDQFSIETVASGEILLIIEQLNDGRE